MASRRRRSRYEDTGRRCRVRPLTQSLIVLRLTPISREIWQLFQPALESLRARSTCSADFTVSPRRQIRRVGLEPTSACAQRLLRPPPLPVWTPPLAQPFYGQS